MLPELWLGVGRTVVVDRRTAGRMTLFSFWNGLLARLERSEAVFDEPNRALESAADIRISGSGEVELQKVSVKA